jgi:Ran GTPase-activating protein (RanGAP) involved in mRNA processing and transport
MQDRQALAFFVAKFADPSPDQTLGWKVTLERHAKIFFEDIKESEQGLKLSILFHTHHNIASLPWAIKVLRRDDDYSNCYLSGKFYYSSCEFKSELCKSLRNNKTLTVLALSDDHLSDADGIRLAEALETNTTLTDLDVSSNYLRHDAGRAFAKALQINHCLRELNFSDNEFINETGIAFLEALKQNETLKVLNLTCNPSLNISSWGPLHQLAKSKGIKIHVGDLPLLRP